MNGVSGVTFKSRTNEASIFMPAGGGRYDAGLYDVFAAIGGQSFVAATGALGEQSEGITNPID